MVHLVIKTEIPMEVAMFQIMGTGTQIGIKNGVSKLLLLLQKFVVIKAAHATVLNL
jgi:hypothetical protein